MDRNIIFVLCVVCLVLQIFIFLVGFVLKEGYFSHETPTQQEEVKDEDKVYPIKPNDY